MGNFEGEGFRGNIGVRIVQTKQTSDGWAVGVPAGTPGAVNNPFGRDRAAERRQRLHRHVAERELRVRSDGRRAVAFRRRARHGASGLQPHRADDHVVHAVAVHRYRRQSGRWIRIARTSSTCSSNGISRPSRCFAALFYKDMQSYIVNGTGTERLPTEIIDPNDSRLSDPDADCQIDRHCAVQLRLPDRSPDQRCRRPESKAWSCRTSSRSGVASARS